MRSSLVFCLDSLLLVGFLLLLSPRMTGLPRHELIGLVFTIPVIIHLVIARPWIRGAARNIASATHTCTRINLVLNSILFLLVVSEILSGLEISQVLLPSLGWLRINDRTWRALHNQTLNWIHLLVCLHIAINWNWVTATFKRLASNPRRVTFAPSRLSVLLWVVAILAVATVVGTMIYGLLGHPTIARLYPQDEIARFRPTRGHGLGQFFGESMMTALVVYVARRWLRLRI